MMKNEELIREYRETSKLMKELAASGNLEERNLYVPRMTELSNQIDWGYRKGDLVERKTGRGWEEDVIQEVRGSEIHFRTMILPPAMIRRPIKNQKTIIEMTFEQISLFS
ncbi:hypothetical protein [Planococcus rifietoensis]|uniref:hypothetical protein n=2 Tax=Planococcus TaxID=1372 RepID=UPI00268DD2D5